MRPIRIESLGKALPSRRVSSAELDRQLGRPAGSVRRSSGVETRYFAEGESSVELGARAGRQALERAGLQLADIDVVVSASGTRHQPLPCGAALLLEALTDGEHETPIAAFDIDSTCLSFVTALDLLGTLIGAGRFERALVISAEVASAGVDWEDLKTAALFGDGAAAAVIAPAPAGSPSTLLHAALETHPAGAHLTEVRGGGTALPGWSADDDNRREFTFDMNGKEVFRMALQRMPEFVARFLKDASVDPSELALVVPHQASPSALKSFIRSTASIPNERIVYSVEDYGNTVAAGIPLALCQAVDQARVARGELVLLIGTGAGFACGAALLRY